MMQFIAVLDWNFFKRNKRWASSAGLYYRASPFEITDCLLSGFVPTHSCFRKIDEEWKIVHEHESVLFYMDGSFKAAVDLKPTARFFERL
jgi:hypothetical protein